MGRGVRFIFSEMKKLTLSLKWYWRPVFIIVAPFVVLAGFAVGLYQRFFPPAPRF